MKKFKFKSLKAIGRLIDSERSPSSIIKKDSEDGKFRGTKRKAESGSFLAEDNKRFARERREIEQQSERKFARVHAKDHSQEENTATAGDEFQPSSIKEHPFFKDNPRFSGIPDGLTPEPPQNSAARTEYDNEKRDKELRLSLVNAPKMSSTPKPRPGGL